MSVSKRFPVLFALSGLLLAGTSGCPDAQAEFDEFVDNTEDMRIGDVGMQTGAFADINGTFLLAAETILGPGLPLQFLTEATLVIADDGQSGTLTLSLQPLSLNQGSATEPREPVGDPIVVADMPVDMEGTFIADLGMVSLIGETNPISGGEISADLQFEGAIQSEDLFCGNLTGDVFTPVEAFIGGSTFAAVRLDDPDNLPTELVVACPDMP